MFSTKGRPLFAQLMHNLATFDLWTSSHAAALSGPIRILPKSLYGKNAKDGEAPHSFFSHFYGNSWHADDAAFIGFLGHWDNKLMLAAVVVLSWVRIHGIAHQTAQAGYALDR